MSMSEDEWAQEEFLRLNPHAETTKYELLKRHGHSPVKAAEIILDAKRGDRYALVWIEIAKAAYATGHVPSPSRIATSGTEE